MSLIDWLIADTPEFLRDEITRSRVWRKRHYMASHRRATRVRKRTPIPPLDQMPTDRGVAMVSRQRFFFSGIACSHGHLSARYTSSGNCVQCSIEHAKRRYQREKVKA